MEYISKALPPGSAGDIITVEPDTGQDTIRISGSGSVRGRAAPRKKKKRMPCVIAVETSHLTPFFVRPTRETGYNDASVTLRLMLRH
jgi:hypothetical protein